MTFKVGDWVMPSAWGSSPQQASVAWDQVPWPARIACVHEDGSVCRDGEPGGWHNRWDARRFILWVEWKLVGGPVPTPPEITKRLGVCAADLAASGARFLRGVELALEVLWEMTDRIPSAVLMRKRREALALLMPERPEAKDR